MARKPLLLGLVGHGTTGTDGIAPGIHLRWQFHPDLGFPKGAFRLYRRAGAAGPPASCFHFLGVPPGSPPAYLERPPSTDRLHLVKPSETLRVVERRTDQAPYSTADRNLLPHLPTGRIPPVVRVLEIPSGGVRFRLPQPSHEVSLHVEFQAFGKLTCRAFAGGEEVAGVAATSLTPVIRAVTVEAPVMEEMEVRASRVAVIQVCHRSVEPCDAVEGWEPLGEPVCLPVYYPGRPCKGLDTPDCDEIEIAGRLPKDPCERLRYEGQVTQDLVASLRVVVEPDLELPQAERLLPGVAEPDDCPPPGEPAPRIEMPAIDALLTAALEPAVARILGLYRIDQPGAGTYDYKVTGDWPVGSLWRLPHSLTFDEIRPGRRWLNMFVVGALSFMARTRATIIDRANPRLRTKRALAFLETDAFDWNLPAHPSLPRPGEDRAVVIWFPEPVGEAQVYVGQETPNVQLQAFGAGGPISGKVALPRRDGVLPVHGAAPDDRIHYIVLSGSRFWIHRVSWGPDRIGHGTHCAFAYGLSVRDAPRPGKPAGVVAQALPGLVQKAADCEPLRTGATRDARFNIGVDWIAPEDRSDLPGDVPVRYDVIRVDADGREALATEDGPVLVGLPPDDRVAPPYVPPPDWPAWPPRFIDTALEPGRYRYRVVGIDIFGRRSTPSDPSAEVTPQPPPSPAPTMLEARFLDPADPRLAAEDRALLPDGSDGAIRIRWLWSEEAQRAAPDATGFRVHYAPGLPNVLQGTVQSIAPANDRATVTVLLEGLADAPVHLLAGRLLAQGRRTFRILDHAAGTATGAGMVIDLQVRLPPAASTSRPIEGPCTVALDATIPVEVRSVQRTGTDVTVELRTTALAAAPSSDLLGSELRLQGERVSLASAEAPVFDVTKSEWRSRCTVPAETDVDALLAVVPPVFVPLQLPPPATPAYRDQGSPAGWPARFDVVLPRTTTGDFDLLVRKPAAGETTGLTQPAPGRYVLVVDTLPAGLDVSLNTPQRQIAFGVSCVGPGALESAVGAPAVLTRAYRACAADLAAAAEVPLSVPAPGAHRYADPPDYAGKSSYRLTWPHAVGWAHQVYRALHDTLYKTDEIIRAGSPAVGTNCRFPSDAERNAFVDAYPDYVRGAVRDLVVNPGVLDRAAIEDHDYVDTLLQALGSLPGNEAAFTRLDLEVPVIGQEFVCVDDTLDGRAQGIYLYRVRAVGPAANLSKLGRAMTPVWVRGTNSLPAPAWNAGYAEASQIVLEWNVGSAQVARYAIFRAEGPVALPDPAHMGPPLHEAAAGSFTRVDVGGGRTVLRWADTALRPGTTYSYRIQARTNSALDQQGVSRSINVTARIPLEAPAPVVGIGGTGKPEIRWAVTPPGAEILVQHARHVRGPWYVRGTWVPGADLRYVDDVAVPGEPNVYRLLLRVGGRVSAASFASDPVVMP